MISPQQKSDSAPRPLTVTSSGVLRRPVPTDEEISLRTTESVTKNASAKSPANRRFREAEPLVHRYDNPNEVYIDFAPSEKVVTRKLVFRNKSKKEFVLKLVPSHKLIEVATPSCVFPPRSIRTVEFRVRNNFGTFEKHMQSLRGYAVPSYKKDLEMWLAGNVHCPTQLAFELNLRIGTGGYSAHETIVDLPGTARLIEKVDISMDEVDDNDCVTIKGIEEDTFTAHEAASQMSLMENLKKPAAACWLSSLLTSVTGQETEKSIRKPKIISGRA